MVMILTVPTTSFFLNITVTVIKTGLDNLDLLEEEIVGIALDSENNIYLTGQTRGTLAGSSFGGASDIFIMKINSPGINNGLVRSEPIKKILHME